MNVSGFRNRVANAPLELTTQAAVSSPTITIPMPDGSFAWFHIQESPIMEPDLAALLPDVKTYRIEGIDDPTATGRVDFTPEGFHGLILSPAGTVFIDPYRRGDTTHYMSYWRHDYARPAGAPPFHCGFAEVNRPTVTSASKSAAASHHVAPLAASGATLRTYRLAVACTGEYGAYHGGSKTGAQIAIATTMNRVNGIYEKELAVRMTLVNNTSIVFTNPAGDPYSNFDDADLTVNQTTIDANIGVANYDIGHLLGTGSGGVAYLEAVCGANKAGGLTGLPIPMGDAFDIDYVAHEIGHQFGADHTFNGTTSQCSGNRAYFDAYEPGSGSTIMAYAGICGAENLQSHSDPYFHGTSYDEIVAFTTTGAGSSCALQTSTGNSGPVVSAPAGVTIPRSTPFYLTGSATDPNLDALTYCWEEFDLGTASPPNTDDGSRPIFRSFNPVASPTRTFPNLLDLIWGSSPLGESLPTTTRFMTFRLTARDNKAGGGGVNYASTNVFVTSAAGPFLVTAPNTSVTWASGATHTVTWNVAGTAAAPVSCANVKILLSTNGVNLTFPITLLASTPNDGSQTVTAPGTPLNLGRVRVECTTSPFFDISNVDFTIVSSMGVVATALTSTSVAVSWNSVPGAVSYDVYRRGVGGYSKIGSTSTTGFTDNTAVAATSYLYAVKSINGSASESAMSPPDLATTLIFTDPILTPQSTIVRAVHLSELRTAVNAVRALAAAGTATFTDPTLTVGSTTIMLAHMAELRAALDAARVALGLSPVAYTDTVLTSQSTIINAAHMNDLRSGVQ